MCIGDGVKRSGSRRGMNLSTKCFNGRIYPISPILMLLTSFNQTSLESLEDATSANKQVCHKSFSAKSCDSSNFNNRSLLSWVCYDVWPKRGLQSEDFLRRFISPGSVKRPLIMYKQLNHRHSQVKCFPRIARQSYSVCLSIQLLVINDFCRS